MDLQTNAHNTLIYFLDLLARFLDTYGYHWNRREPLNVGQNPMTLNEQEERSFCACAEGHLIIDEINFRHVYVSWRMRSNNDPPAHMR